MDMDAGHRDRAASGSDTGEVPGVGSRSAPPGNDLVVLGDLIMHVTTRSGKAAYVASTAAA
jgi:hypothetical protein